MNLLSKENPDRWHHFAWWFCIVSAPWLSVVNSVSIIVLTLLTITDKGFFGRLKKLKEARWSWPFFGYYLLLVLGLLYTPDLDTGLTTLSQKCTFILLPLIAVTGRKLSDDFIHLLRLSFVYSCTLIILISLAVSTIHFMDGGVAANFDINSKTNYQTLHPNASPVWMYFSYIELSRWVDLHPAYFSMYLVFCLVILFTRKYSSQMQSMLHLIIGIIISGFVSMLSARMAIIAFIFSALFFGIKKFREGKPNAAFPILGTSVVLALLLWLNPVARFRVVEEPMKTSYSADSSVTQWNSVSYRLLEWKGSWSIIRDHPLLGVGTSGWRVAMSKFYSGYSSTNGVLYNSHNQFLQTWMENGILALVALSLCIFGSLFRPNIDPSYTAFILIFSLMCLTESILDRQKGIVFFTLFQSMFLAFENK